MRGWSLRRERHRGERQSLVSWRPSCLPPKLLCELRSFCLKSVSWNFGHLPWALSSPHMPFSIHPRIGRTKSSSSREKKSWSGEGGGWWEQVGRPLGLSQQWCRQHIVYFWVRAPPRMPLPLTWQSSEAATGMGGRAVASTFGKLRCLGTTSLTTPHTGRNGKGRGQVGDKKTICSVLRKKRVTPGLGGERGWETSGQQKQDGCLTLLRPSL